MATINIDVDQNQDVTVNITDVTAAADENILVQFFENSVNVFNKAVVALGGAENDIVINAGASYDVIVKAGDALKLNGVTNSYKMFKLNDDGTFVLKNEGSVTVEPLDPEQEPEPPPPGSDINELIKYVNAPQTLKTVSDAISDASAQKVYSIKFMPGATIGSGFVAHAHKKVSFENQSAIGLDFLDSDWTNQKEVFYGLNVRGADFSNATIPLSKSEFRDVVSGFDPETTIWTDGNPIGKYGT